MNEVLLLRGVETIKGDGYTLHQVLDFSDEMKSALRKELVSICRGVSALCSRRKTDSYKAVVGELVTRVLKKDENGRKGVIGELLVHLMVKVEMPDKRAASALFNLEDRSFKKGFDLTLCDSVSNALWFTEVKSGEAPQNSSLADTMDDLLMRAKRDLIHRSIMTMPIRCGQMRSSMQSGLLAIIQIKSRQLLRFSMIYTTSQAQDCTTTQRRALYLPL